MKFYSLFKLEYVSWKFNPCSVRLHLTKYVSWNNRDKTKRTQIHFWSDIFAAVMSSDRKVPFDGAAHGSFRKTWNDNWRSSLPRTHNTHLLTLQVNCDKGETQRRRDYSWIFCLFARKLGTSVDQSKHAIYNSAISKQKQKIALRQGWQWAFKQTTFE